jgi:hypothetical protein
MQLKKWKKPRKFQRMMIRAGYPVNEAKRTWIKMTKWQSVARRPVRFVLNLKSLGSAIFISSWKSINCNGLAADFSKVRSNDFNRLEGKCPNRR